MSVAAQCGAALALTAAVAAQQPAPPAPIDPRIQQIVDSVSATRIGADVTTLAAFGTRSTYSDTVSSTRGIGAARRWIKAQFDRISAQCGHCLTVTYVQQVRTEGAVRPVNVVNVVAIQRGTAHPDRYIIMSGDIDSRATNVNDSTSDAPGANDNASGMAGVLEAARVLSKDHFGSSIVYLGLSGEEEGLWGGEQVAGMAKEQGWDVVGMLNNDMIGNIEGISGITDNSTFRVFSEPTPVTETDQARRLRRYYGGEVDGPSRQLARYVARMADLYVRNLDPIMIYRLDRFGRGGHHRPFNDVGFAAVRIMETNENYTRQHQNVRVENGIHYGDVVSGVNFPYAAKLAEVNAATLAGLAWAPPAPDTVRIGGAVSPSTTLAWSAVNDPNLAGYKIYWRDTTAPQWQHWVFVGKDVTRHTLENIVIDNFLFGVASVGTNGNESVVAFPSRVMR